MKITSLFAGVALSAAALLAPAVARADASCTTAMANHFNWDANGPANLIRYQKIQYVYVKDDGSWTEYSSGTLYYNGGVGSAERLDTQSPLLQYFSDRVNGTQPFYAGATDQTSVTGIDNQGNVTLYDNTWGFSSTFDASCTGNRLLANTSDGSIVITIVDASTPRLILK